MTFCNEMLGREKGNSVYLITFGLASSGGSILLLMAAALRAALGQSQLPAPDPCCGEKIPLTAPRPRQGRGCDGSAQIPAEHKHQI